MPSQPEMIVFVKIAVVVIFGLIGVCHALCAIAFAGDTDGSRYFARRALPLLAVTVIAFFSEPLVSVIIVGVIVIAVILFLVWRALS